jgi:hypothetical protein
MDRALSRTAASAAVATVFALALAAPTALAQTTSSGTGLRMPYERDFWGHVGLSLGRAKVDVDCPAGADCDSWDQVFRVYGGGRFNNAIGGEVGFQRFGDFEFAGGDIDSKALDFALVAGIPFGNNWSVFGKLGAVYASTDVTSNVAGVQTGRDRGWGPRYGLGLQMGVTRNWALRADLDRYRIEFPDGRDNIDTLTIGAQYTFR